MRELEGRSEALAGTFKTQEVVNTLCVCFLCSTVAACVFPMLHSPDGGSQVCVLEYR